MRESNVVGAMDVYCDLEETWVDLVLPLAYEDMDGKKQHIRVNLKHFDGEGHERAAYLFASKMGASSVRLFDCRIFKAREKRERS